MAAVTAGIAAGGRVLGGLLLLVLAAAVALVGAWLLLTNPAVGLPALAAELRAQLPAACVGTGGW
jgi:hypothetical protein